MEREKTLDILNNDRSKNGGLRTNLAVGLVTFILFVGADVVFVARWAGKLEEKLDQVKERVTWLEGQNANALKNSSDLAASQWTLQYNQASELRIMENRVGELERRR